MGPLVIPGPEGRLVLAPIHLSNVKPNSGVVVAANSHNPSEEFCPGTVRNKYSGVYAAGAEGLEATSSHCGKRVQQHGVASAAVCIQLMDDSCPRGYHAGVCVGGMQGGAVCVAVESGRAPYANSSLAEMEISRNTGCFATKTC